MGVFTTPRISLRRAADPRVIGGVIVMAGSAYAGLAMAGSGPDAVLIAVAQRDLPAGVEVQADDFAFSEVVIDQPQMYIRDPDFTGRMAVPVAAGELIPRSAVAVASPPTRLVAVPVEVERLPPNVQRGSKVDLWQSGSGQRAPVLKSAVVTEVAIPDQWSGATATVVLSVAKQDVAVLLSATRAGPVDVTAYQGES